MWWRAHAPGSVFTIHPYMCMYLYKTFIHASIHTGMHACMNTYTVSCACQNDMASYQVKTQTTLPYHYMIWYDTSYDGYGHVRLMIYHSSITYTVYRYMPWVQANRCTSVVCHISSNGRFRRVTDTPTDATASAAGAAHSSRSYLYLCLCSYP
mgnify:CR=1 FL=1